MDVIVLVAAGLMLRVVERWIGVECVVLLLKELVFHVLNGVETLVGILLFFLEVGFRVDACFSWSHLTILIYNYKLEM